MRGHTFLMAVTTSKVTYSLKPETVDRVQELTTAWGVAKSDVIRRAVDKLPQIAFGKEMIHLDANILIEAAQQKSQVQDRLRGWLQHGERFSVSALAWAEFLSGPLTAENKLATFNRRDFANFVPFGLRLA